MSSILEALTANPQNKRVIAEKMGWSTREVELEVNRYRSEAFHDWLLASNR